MLTTVSSDILNLLSIFFDPSPKKLIDAVIQHPKTNTATEHKYLKSEAEKLQYTTDMTIQSYVEKHNAIRARLTASHFPNITDETTTVECMIDRLSYSLSTIDIDRQLLPVNPRTVMDFVYRLHRIRSYNKTIHTTPKSTLYHTIYPSSLRQHAQLHPARSQMRSTQYPTSLLPRHQTPGLLPCSFHQKFKPVPTSHRDEQCRDTRCSIVACNPVGGVHCWSTVPVGGINTQQRVRVS